ncbi:ankyrin repeat protein [Acanthamoeba polyphaga mimivirus]|uniref:Ankyrin repeat protein n=1 Tax=Acanthamoeba polyphaga mimivirus TaxID=212035 RepID=A0A2L2DKH3_MIMIV|nr:ankyrin repeat protein [Acanthamoeba polyphaga mimivirus]
MRIPRINNNDLFAIIIKLRQYVQDNKIDNENTIDLINLIDSIIENDLILIKSNIDAFNTFTDISLIYYANKMNDVNILDNYVFNNHDNKYYTYFALSIGAIDIFKWLVSHGFPYDMSEILNFLQKNYGMNLFGKIFDDNFLSVDYTIINDIIVVACSNEMEECIDYLVRSKHAVKITRENLICVIEHAITINNCDIIKILVKKFTFWANDYRKIFIQAVKNNNVQITKTLLHSLMYRTNKETLIGFNNNEALKYAITMKNYDMIKLLVDYNIQTDHLIKYHIEGTLDLKNDNHLNKINKYIDKKLCNKCFDEYQKMVIISL